MNTADLNLLSRRYARSTSVVFRQIGDEILLVPIYKTAAEVDSFYTLNDVARCIWTLLDGTRSLKDVRDAIVAGYDVTADVAEKDLLEFVVQLEQISAIESSAV